MTETLAVEWVRYGINVNAIAPGMFSSEMMNGMVSRIGDPTDSLPREQASLTGAWEAQCNDIRQRN